MSDAVWREFPDFLARFLSHVELAVDGSGCWLWQGATDPKGYPNVVVPHGFPGAGRSRRMKGLRVSMALFRGIVLGNRQAHHCAENCTRECVCPDHGEVKRASAHYVEHHPTADVSEWELREAMGW